MDSTWKYSTIHKSPCKVIDEQTFWGPTACRVRLSNQDAVVRVPQPDLQPLATGLPHKIESRRIAYITAAAKVAELLASSSSVSDGHPEVRQFKLARPDEDQSQWRSELRSARRIVPEIRPLSMLHIGDGGVRE